MGFNSQITADVVPLVRSHKSSQLDEVWRHALQKVYDEIAAIGIFFQIKKSREPTELAGASKCAGVFLLDLKEQHDGLIVGDVIRSLAQAGAQIGLRYPVGFEKNAGLTAGIEQRVIDTVFRDHGMRLSAPISWRPFPYKDTFQFTILSTELGSRVPISRKNQALIMLTLVEFTNEFLRLVHLGKLTEKKLTAKQVEILHLIGSERTDQEIADLLGISCSAVRRRIEAVQMKFSTTKRLGLIVKAMQSGTILDTILTDIY